MWSTHPANSEREQNAKRRYVAAEIDERSAWELFDDVADLKKRMTAHVFRAVQEAADVRWSNRSPSSTSNSDARTTIERIAAHTSVARWRATRAKPRSSTVRR